LQRWRIGEPNVQTAKALVGEQGYEPAKGSQAGTQSQFTFVRTTGKTCGTEVVSRAAETTSK